MESPGALREAKESAAAKKENSEHLRRTSNSQSGSGAGGTHQGFIAALKDGFGFVETLTREKEIFFHFSNVEGKSDKLEGAMEEVLNGKVVRPLRSVNPD